MELQMSSTTVVDWSNFCREVCIGFIVDASECIRGPGIVVEIDEAKMVKRKYNRGRIIDGQWVFGDFELESKKVLLCTGQVYPPAVSNFGEDSAGSD
ncbi:hypothetical protein NQ314_010212 [Rhamnusium bicolor]|uniref:Uncharacterized protein n=1 Tax=Rhamnusium bicolor TaxID=1586634 RepID=A0AAV8XTN8_9CUCU|nr:hypothetical protein NQ314_010212 [Rhamnusium bicolor]